MDYQFTYSLFAQLIFFFALSANASSISVLQTKLKDLNSGKSVDMKMYQGKTTLLTFFQPGCESCKSQLKSFQCLEKRHPYKFNIAYLGTFANEKELIVEVKKSKLPYPAYLATEAYLKSVGGIKYTPYTLVADKDGLYVTNIYGSISCEKLDKLLKP